MQITKLFIFAIPAALMMLSCARRDVPDECVARVNNSELTQEDMHQLSGDIFYQNQKRQHSLIIDGWVKTELLYQEALKLDLQHDPTLEFQLEQYKKRLLGQYVIDYYISNDITVTDAEILDFYNKNRDEFIIDRLAATILHFLIEDPEEAANVKRVLLYGSAQAKNDLLEKFLPDEKFVLSGNLIPELDEELFSVHRKKVIGPVKTDFGYHVVLVKEVYRAGDYRPIADLRELIKKRIGLRKKESAQTEFINKLRKNAHVEIYENAL